MTNFRKASLAALIALGAALPAVAQVNVTTYSGFTENYGVDLTFSDETGTQTWASINSNVDYPGFTWNDAAVFGANITSTLDVATAGSYTFDLTSDDGSYVFIDGTLVGDEPGAHSSYLTSFSTTLSAGLHSVDVQFYNEYCCGSGIELDLPSGVSLVSSVPEPGTNELMLAGLGLMLFGVRRAMRRFGDE